MFFISMGIFVSVIDLIGVCFMKEGEDLEPTKDEQGFWHQFLSVFNFKTFAANKELFWVRHQHRDPDPRNHSGGYVLILQTTTAWAKNLYPEESRGQFEGVRIVFFVLIPMVVGPSVATAVINRFGIPVTIDGEAGMAPSAILFVLAAVISVLTLIPTAMAEREKRKKNA